MGHKVHPLGFRIGIIRGWQAKWYADKHFAESLQEDVKLRQAIQDRYREAGISLVEIERQANEVSITIHTARPGVVIGRGGQRVDEMRHYLENLVGRKIRLNIQEIQQPELDAYLVARAIAEQIEHRVAYRRAMKQTISRTIQAGAKGVRISCAGRLGGAEIARRQTMHQGRVPLHTLRADIDYGFTEARTTLGRIGIKTWIYKGDIHPEPKIVEAEEVPAEIVAGEQLAVTTPETEAKPVEIAAEVSTEAAPSAEPEPKPAKPVRKEAKITPETEAKPVEIAAEASKEAAPSAEPEPKPAKPVRKKAKATPKLEAKPVEITAEVSKEAAPPAEPEQKPTKPVRKKAKITPETETKPVEITAEVSTEAAPPAEPEEKPAKPVRKKAKATPKKDNTKL